MPGSDFYTYELKGWAGLDTRPNIADKPPNMVEDCQNIDFEQGGVIAKRRGTKIVLSGDTGSRINLLYDFQSQQGFSTLSDKSRTLVIRGEQLQIYNGNTLSQTIAVSDSIHYAVSSDNGLCYLANENGTEVQVLFYSTISSSFIKEDLLIDRPPQNDGSALGFNDAGGYTGGAWKYLYTYVDMFGNESEPASLQANTAKVTVSQTYGVFFDRMELSPSSNDSVEYIKIYACHIGVSVDYHFVGTASNIGYTLSNTFQLPYDDTILSLGSVLPDVSAYTLNRASTISVSISNPGAETGTTDGWTAILSSFTAVTSAAGGLTPHSGSYMFKSDDLGAVHGFYQDVSLPTEAISAIDQAGATLDIQLFGRAWTQHESNKLSCTVKFYEVTPASPIDAYTFQTNAIYGEGVWNTMSGNGQIPPGARGIRIEISAWGESYEVDDISATVTYQDVTFTDTPYEDVDTRGKYLAIYNNNLIIAGNPEAPDLLVISNPVFHRQFDINDFVRVMSNDAQPIIGLKKYSDNLIIGKTKSIYAGYGQYAEVFNAKELDTDHGALGQGCLVSAQRRYVILSDNGIFVGYGGNIFDEISEPIRTLIRSLNKSSLNSIPTKAFVCDFTWAQKVLFSVREASGSGENDTIIVFDYSDNGSLTKYKGISACYLAQLTDSNRAKYIYGGKSDGYCFLFTHEGMDSIENNDNHSGTISAISAYVETPWINLPKAVGIQWPRALTESVWMQVWAGGEPASGDYITLQTNVYTDFDDTTIKGTFSTTHHAEAYPSVTCDPKTIENFAGDSTVFENIKFKISNNSLGEHFKLHKLVFGFRARPSVEK